MEIEEFIDRFCTWGFDRRRWSDKTQELYAERVRRADRWFDTPWDQLTEDDVRAWMTTLPATAASRNLARKGLMWFFAFLVDLGRRDDNPTDAIDPLPLPRALPRALENGDAAKLYAGARERGPIWAAAVAVMLYAGLRVNEMLSLRWAQLEGDWIHLTGKGGQERVVPIAGELADALAAWRPDCPDPVWVFPSPRQDGPISATTVRRRLTAICEDVGIARVTPHQLRHTCGTRMAERGVDVRVIQEFLGHASLDTTYRYLMVRPHRMAEAVGRLDWTEPQQVRPAAA